MSAMVDVGAPSEGGLCAPPSMQLLLHHRPSPLSRSRRLIRCPNPCPDPSQGSAFTSNDPPCVPETPCPQVFTTDAYSTAYKFPLVDAKIQEQADGSITIEVPLDGTVYDMITGKVLKWCPGGNPLQSVLKSIKKDSPAIDLPVYTTILQPDGKIMVDYQNVLGA
ncbi:MAG: hypothetical protein WDW38_009786 [Sanguina aurantia]